MRNMYLRQFSSNQSINIFVVDKSLDVGSTMTYSVGWIVGINQSSEVLDVGMIDLVEIEYYSQVHEVGVGGENLIRPVRICMSGLVEILVTRSIGSMEDEVLDDVLLGVSYCTKEIFWMSDDHMHVS